MRFAAVVPFASRGDPARTHALAVVTAHLHREHSFPVVVTYHADPTWSKGVAVDTGVRSTTTEGIIVHDADVLVAPEALEGAIASVEAGAAWAMPHTKVYRLSRRGMMRRLGGPFVVGALGDADLERAPHPAPPGGGIVVLSRGAYERSGGIDPRFIGWGGEDISWARALDTLAGPCARGDAPLWHLWHEPQPSRLRGGRGSRANERLASRYLDAVGDREAMTAVVAR